MGERKESESEKEILKVTTMERMNEKRKKKERQKERQKGRQRE